MDDENQAPTEPQDDEVIRTFKTLTDKDNVEIVEEQEPLPAPDLPPIE